MRTLHLDILEEGLPGITVAMGIYMHEAILVAMIKNGHQSGVILQIEGTFQEEIILQWNTALDKTKLNAWRNDGDIAHYAAVGLSLLLMTSLTDFQSFEQAEYNTGIDYWMDNKPFSKSKPFTRLGRLEISGIFKETSSNTVQMRINQKKKQVAKSSNSNLNAWIAIVAFNTPRSKIERQ